ncbi:uncharacterized protein DS421_3g84930 [Arachis hypogaea]|nr:uncharacterized protein DS421_3g84930 [Arachis hypogaea]
MERQFHARHSNDYASKKPLVMAHSSSSPSKITQILKFRATFQTEETFELVANNSRNHQQNIIQGTLLFYSSCTFSTFLFLISKSKNYVLLFFYVLLGFIDLLVLRN